MSSVHCVVVWEFQCGGQWVPHTPGVTRTLERAHAKKLTRVVLADADPSLKGHHVNLRTLTQGQDMPDGGVAECGVRRSCYSVQSVGGRGARWEWAPFCAPPQPAELRYEPMPMEGQCAVEEAWCAGGGVIAWRGWALCARAGLARRGAAVRLLRRAPQPPYPLARADPQPAPPPPSRHRTPPIPCVPQQHTGSSVQSAPPRAGAHTGSSVQSAPSRAGARSASPRERPSKPNLARQILHNLNIFSNNKHGTAECSEPERGRGGGEGSGGAGTDTECGSTRSTRRHSVDTVSTYLSHESKDSLQQGSVGELLNCSGGSDDVFEAAEPRAADERDAADVRALWAGAGADAGGWVRGVACPQWGAVCPVCLRPLGGGAGRVVALAACQHMLHLACLADQLREAEHRAALIIEGAYIECLVCGRAYPCPRGGVRPPAPLPAPPAQPPGSMAWRLQPVPLPQCQPSNSILITYNFQSGVQSAGHPAPGAPYYAVGFPRHSVLPDDELGQQVLSALRACWSVGALFSVSASRTTGREHVVAWRAPPPPAAPRHYRPPARPAALLAALLHALRALLEEHAH